MGDCPGARGANGGSEPTKVGGITMGLYIMDNNGINGIYILYNP